MSKGLSKNDQYRQKEEGERLSEERKETHLHTHITQGSNLEITQVLEKTPYSHLKIRNILIDFFRRANNSELDKATSKIIEILTRHLSKRDEKNNHQELIDEIFESLDLEFSSKLEEKIFFEIYLILLKNTDSKENLANKKSEEMGRHFFDKYKKPGEEWSRSNFYHWWNILSECPDENKAEKAVLWTLGQYRAELSMEVEKSPQAEELIKKADEFFQAAFSGVFKIRSPISLVNCTMITEHAEDPHALKGIGKSVIYYKDFESTDLETTLHHIIHEAIHLCTDGFNDRAIDESMVEYIIQRMHIENPREFQPRPITTYKKYTNSLSLIFEVLPELEEFFLEYYRINDLDLWKRKVREFFTGFSFEQVKEDIKKAYTENYSKDFPHRFSPSLYLLQNVVDNAEEFLRRIERESKVA